MSARPELAVLIARITTGWSRVEERLGFLVVELLGAHAHTGMQMYQALSGAASQKAVLRAVARDRLSAEAMDKLEEILAAMKSVGSKRNNVVHGFWQVSDDLPSDLVWCDSSDSLLSHSEFWGNYLSKAEPERMQWALQFTSRPKYLVYKKDDFLRIIEDIESLLDRLTWFLLNYKLRKPPSDVTSLGSA